MLTLERLKALLEYDPESGLWSWKQRMGSRAAKGQIAGSLHYIHGYIAIRVDKRSYRSHRLAWFYMTGDWPRHEIDHINLCPADNRWANLREATRNQNNANRASYAKSGFKGVSSRDNKWTAIITVGGQQKYLGLFDTPEEAHAAYCRAASEYHGEYARFD